MQFIVFHISPIAIYTVPHMMLLSVELDLG